MAHTIDGDVIDFAMAPPVSLLFFFFMVVDYSVMCPTVAQRSRISPLVDERVCGGDRAEVERNVCNFTRNGK